MGGIFRNQPVILTCITIILASPILGTKSAFSTALKQVTKGVVEDRNEFVSVNFVWDNRTAYHLWVDMDKYQKDIVTLTDDDFNPRNEMYYLQLSFYFHFFGHYIRDLKITKHRGLRSVGFFDKWFITPLILEPNEIKHCKVKYVDTGNLFLIQWEIETFDDWDNRKLIIEVLMFDDGRVGFNYKKIPFGSLKKLSQKFDGIKNILGIAYALQLPDGILRLDYVKDIKEFNDLREGLLILFKPLSSCLFYTSCALCSKIVDPFKCSWCPSLKACSSKMDLLQEMWQSNNCDSEEISIDNQCPQYSEPLINKESPPVVEVPVIEPLAVEKGPASSLYIPTSILVIASLLIFGVLCYIERCSRFFVRLCSRRNPFRPGQHYTRI